MARDYARQRNPNTPRGRGNGAGRGSGGKGKTAALVPGWVWLMLGLTIGLAVAAFVYVGRDGDGDAEGDGGIGKLGAARSASTESDGRRPDETEAEAITKKSGAKATTKAAGKGGGKPSDKAVAEKDIELPPKQPSRFAFYEMLPSYEVVIPRENARAAAGNQPPPPPDVQQALAAPGQYLIQVGAYRSREEADRQRANLALVGVESRIEQVTIDQRDTWYRVRIGPEATLAAAQEILDRLESNDIKGLLIKVKG